MVPFQAPIRPNVELKSNLLTRIHGAISVIRRRPCSAGQDFDHKIILLLGPIRSSGAYNR